MTASNASHTSQRPWWSFGHVWLLISGPAIVVVAGFFTFYLAVRMPDPVLPTQVVAPDPAQGDNISQAPAMQARNHAATGNLPAATSSQKP